MGTKKWSEIKTLSKANVADRAEARAELDEEIRSYCAPEVCSHPPTSQPDIGTQIDRGSTTNRSPNASEFGVSQ